MRLLFDENTPFSLAKELTGHECGSVTRLGWQGTKNGALLTRAETAGFEVLITLDDNMQTEQNMTGRRIAVLVLRPAGQGKKAVSELAGDVLLALAEITHGEIRTVSRSPAE